MQAELNLFEIEKQEHQHGTFSRVDSLVGLPIISLWQPWASWILFGWKTIETRTHNKFANLKGKTIGIHASKKMDRDAFDIAKEYLTEKQITKHNTETYPLGCIIAIADVVKTQRLDWIHSDRALIECHSERYGLFLENVKAVNPFFCGGSQGIWYLK